MVAKFNNAANSYDHDFTNLFTGKQQREVVWNYLNKNFTSPLNILEINCGTGEDALFLSKQGHIVLATDISDQMIEVALQKQHVAGNGIKPIFQVCGFNDLNTIEKKFDLVFSNFGGLNCISPEQLSRLSLTLAGLLNTNGRLVAVTMPPICIWELFYFALKLRFNKALRRWNKKPALVSVGGVLVSTWYFTPRQFANQLKREFKTVKQVPVGIAIPPPFMEPLLIRFPRLQNILVRLEKRLGKLSFLANVSDHFLTDMKKKLAGLSQNNIAQEL